MKMTDKFDPPSLRPKRPGRWRWRFAAAIAAVIATLGILSAMAGVAPCSAASPRWACCTSNREPAPCCW